MLRLGITGGVASGKSEVSKILLKLGCLVIDADEVAARLLVRGTAIFKAVVSALGAHILDAEGRIDKAVVRSIIFRDKANRALLDSIMHPVIHAEIMCWTQQASSPLCAIVIPLLVETRMYDLVDRILLVDAKRKTQKKRVVERDGVTGKIADQILASQASRVQRAAVADYVIDNDGCDTITLSKEVEALYSKLLVQVQSGLKPSSRQNSLPC